MDLNHLISSLHLFHMPFFLFFSPTHEFNPSFDPNPTHDRDPPPTAHHLSPQALKWKEYRRRNPLGVERIPGGHTGNLEHRSGGLPRPPRRNVFDFPSALSGHTLGRLNGAHNFTDNVGRNGRLWRYVKSRLGYISTNTFVKEFKVQKNALFGGHWQNTVLQGSLENKYVIGSERLKSQLQLHN